MASVLETPTVEAETRYRDAVGRRAAGEPVPDALEVAMESGRTAEQFSADVRLRRERDELAEQLEAADAGKRELSEAAAAADEAAQRFREKNDRAYADYLAKVRPFREQRDAAVKRLEVARAAMPPASQAAVKLHATGDPAIEAEMKRASQRLRDRLELANKVTAATVQEAREAVEADRAAVQNPKPKSGQTVEQARAAARIRLERADARLADVEEWYVDRQNRRGVEDEGLAEIHRIGTKRLEPACMRYSEPAGYGS